jgi:hypothetical protein
MQKISFVAVLTRLTQPTKRTSSVGVEPAPKEMAKEAVRASRGGNGELLREAQVFANLLILSFVGLFLFCSQFGFYEDDYLFVLPTYEWNVQALLLNIQSCLTHWPQGRPVGFALCNLLDFLVTRFNSLEPAFLIACLLVALNGFLFFNFAKQFVPRLAAFVSAALFVLYPPDSSKQMIMLEGFQLLNMTLLLLAFLLYSRSRIALSYVTAFLCLLIYEHFFFPFVAAPFFLASKKRASVRRWIFHGIYCVGAPLACILVRKLIGEQRAQDVLGNPESVLGKMAAAVGLGLWNSVATFGWRLSDFLRNSQTFYWGIFALVFAYLIWSRPSWHQPGLPDEQSNGGRKALNLVLGGAVAWAAGYLLAFRPDNFPPTLSLGRLSGFNAPGSLGFCLVLGGILTFLMRMRSVPQQVWLVGSAIVISIFTATCVYVQRIDYVNSWRLQKDFLKQLVRTFPCWQPDTKVVIDLDESDRSTPGTPGFRDGWLSVYPHDVLRFLVSFDTLPKEQAADGSLIYPAVVACANYFQTKVEPAGIRLLSPVWNPAWWPLIRGGNFFVLRFHEGVLENVPGSFRIGNAIFEQQSFASSGRMPKLSRAGLTLLREERLWSSVKYGKPHPTSLPFRGK